MGRRSKVVNVLVNTFGNYLGTQNGCIVLRDNINKKEKKYPLFENEVGEMVIRSGNLVSTDALSSLASWGIGVLITTKNGRPVAEVRSLDDDSHVETRISQYEALKNGKGIDIAKQIVKAKIHSQNQMLRKH